MEEEDKDNSHPDLWLKFSNGLGVNLKDVKSVKLNQETKDLIDGAQILLNLLMQKVWEVYMLMNIKFRLQNLKLWAYQNFMALMMKKQ